MMKLRSIKTNLYLLTIFMFSLIIIVPITYFFQHSAVDDANAILRSVAEIENEFSEISILENMRTYDSERLQEITPRYEALSDKLTQIKGVSGHRILKNRQIVFGEFIQIKKESNQLFKKTHSVLTDLIHSIKYIHAHHIVYFKNMFRRGAFEQDYDSPLELERGGEQSASEIDIIASAAVIQTNLFTIVDIFNDLQFESDFNLISSGFDKGIKAFFSSVNNYEDLSLDAQDGLLVEELLLSGREFERSFESLLILKDKNADLLQALEQNRDLFLAYLDEFKKTLHSRYQRTIRDILIFQSFLIITILLVVFIVAYRGKYIVSEINKTVSETEKIRENLTYQIDIDNDTFDEFRVVFEALNSMSSKINTHVTELQRHQNGLEETVKERTAELLKTNKKLSEEITERIRFEKEKDLLQSQLQQSEKMRAVGTLAGGIAHDFNNILSAILGYSELAKINLPDDSNTIRYIDEILNAGKRATELVNQILSISRKTTHQLQYIQPHLIVKEALRMLRASMPATLSIEDKIDPECGYIQADPTKVHQIVVNLCTNAFHAMENEKGILTVSLYRKDIGAEDTKESDISPGSFIVLSISDTGHGMDRETLDRVFEPYFTTKEVGKGTGLGLAVIHGIVKDYKGFIRVESEPGKGSTFHIHFPAIEQVVSTQEITKTEAHLPMGTERILTVDDESSIVDLHKTVLTHLGYTVTTTINSKEALEKIRLHPEQFDLMITDQTMPELTGVELAQEVLQIRPGMPIILCTGYSSIITEESALATGIKKYTKKPVNISTLANIVRQVLDNY